MHRCLRHARARPPDDGRGPVRRRVLGLHSAAADERVTAAILLNPGLLEWQPDASSSSRRGSPRAAPPIELVASGARAATVRLERVRVTSPPLCARGRRACGAAGRGRRGRRRTGPTRTIRPAVDPRRPAARTRRSDGVLGRESLYVELARAGSCSRSPSVARHAPRSLVGRDHTLRPISAQRAAACVARSRAGPRTRPGVAAAARPSHA